LIGDVGFRARELLREIARSNEMMIYAGAINRNHVYMLISIPPHSATLAVQGPTFLGARLLGGVDRQRYR
jgi:putative transposase